MGAKAASKVQWLHCDLSDWKAITETAKKIKSSKDRLNILINNAARGIKTAQITPYGVGEHVAINHIVYVVLTSHLLPLLKKTALDGNTVRIVNLDSNTHQGASSDTKFANLEELNRDLGPNRQYGCSKLATVLYTNGVHPGS